jgi:hypothetical protein
MAKAHEVQCSIDGTGAIDVERLESERVAVSVDGMGRVVATGTADSVEIHVDGTGEVDTRQLAARHVVVEIDGVGKVFTRAEETLDVRVDGFGRVEYAGNPRVRERADGACRVVRLDPSEAAPRA